MINLDRYNIIRKGELINVKKSKENGNYGCSGKT